MVNSYHSLAQSLINKIADLFAVETEFLNTPDGFGQESLEQAKIFFAFMSDSVDPSCPPQPHILDGLDIDLSSYNEKCDSYQGDGDDEDAQVIISAVSNEYFQFRIELCQGGDMFYFCIENMTKDQAINRLETILTNGGHPYNAYCEYY